MTSGFTYLDHAATTPVRPEAVEAMAPFLAGTFGNPSGAHAAARAAKTALEAAREEVVRALAEGGVSPQIGATFGLEEAPDALIALGERRLAGKGVLVVKHGSAG